MRVVGVAGILSALAAGCLSSPPGSIQADAGDERDAAATGDAAPDPCAGLPALVPFTDDFSTDDLAWAIEPKVQRDGPGLVDVEVAGGELVFKPTSAGGDNAWVKSEEFNFSTGRVVVRVPSLSTDDDTEAYLAVLGPNRRAAAALRRLSPADSTRRKRRLPAGRAPLVADPQRGRPAPLRDLGRRHRLERGFEASAAGFLLDAVRMRLGVSVAAAGPEERGQFAVDDLNLPPCGQ